jgi:rare lipoprotein A
MRDHGYPLARPRSAMTLSTRRSNLGRVAIVAAFAVATCGLAARADSPQRQSPQKISPRVKAPIDRSGKKRVGKASFYAHMFAGRKMADGNQMDPRRDNAASRTLPLGTTAKVTNLETGKTALVTIQDRGPYVDGRIVDLSPSTAREIGLSHRQGVTRVEVSPLAVPLPNGGVKLGAAGQATLARNDRASPFPPVGW